MRTVTRWFFFLTFLQNERIQSKEEKTCWTFIPVDCEVFFLGFVMYTDNLKDYIGGDRCSSLGRFLFTVHGGVTTGRGRCGVGGGYQTKSLCWDNSQRAGHRQGEFIFFLNFFSFFVIFVLHQDNIKCTEKTKWRSVRGQLQIWVIRKI